MTLRGVHRFSATTVSEAVVAAPPEDIWAAITDPTVLPKLTPLLRYIEADGDLWRWDLSRINVLGIVVDPSVIRTSMAVTGSASPATPRQHLGIRAGHRPFNSTMVSWLTVVALVAAVALGLLARMRDPPHR